MVASRVRFSIEYEFEYSATVREKDRCHDMDGRRSKCHQGGSRSSVDPGHFGQSGQPERARSSPEIAISAAHQEAALAALGETQGPETTMLQNVTQETETGRTRGRHQVWPNASLAKPSLAQTKFGQVKPSSFWKVTAFHITKNGYTQKPKPSNPNPSN